MLPTSPMTRARSLAARLAAALALSALAAGAQGAPPDPAADREAVRRAALDYIEGFYEGDSTRLVRSVSPDVFKAGYSRPHPDSAFRASRMPYPGFMSYARGVREGRNRTPANAPKEIAIYDVQDQTASAKLTAYWGTDYLLLAKEQGRWMITHVLWQSAPASR